MLDSRMRSPSILAVAGLALGAASPALAQDSVALTPGGNDSVAAFDPAAQRLRYVVDLAPATTSWNSPILVAPIIKASRDTDPLFRTQILGSIAASPSQLSNISAAGRNFSLWSTPGAGVSPTNNSAPSTVQTATFASQFAVGLSDFSITPSSAVGAVVGRSASNFARLYVERVVAATSRSTAAGLDTSTVSLGGIDPSGDLLIRADAHTALTTTTTRLLGDNIIAINTAARNAGSLNTLRANAGTNTSDDTAATTYVITNEVVPTNTPTVFSQNAGTPYALVYDFASRFRTGSTTVDLTTGSAHLAAGVAGHRGNPGYSPTSAAGGAGGTIASISVPSGVGTRPNQLLAFGLSPINGAPPVVTSGTPRAFTLPSPITVPGFSANASNTAAFRQYLSQVPFRGGNGQVGVGRNAAGSLVLAATANDPTASNFIAVATIPLGGPATWTIAAFPGMTVRSAMSGPSIGTLSTPALDISAPAIDFLGNVYFVAAWKPSLTPVETAVFKAVNTATGYQLEVLLREGQSIAGPNSGRTYTITDLALTDGDSVASSTIFSSSIIQQQTTGASTTDPASPRAFGGLVVAATITYDNTGQNESYDAVLYVGPTGIGCLADFNTDNALGVQDIFDFLAAWFSGDPRADFNSSGGLGVQDIFDFLAAWFAGC
jgi:hypothetical protein